MKIVSTALLSLALVGCTHASPPASEVPEWVEGLIARQVAEPVANPPARIFRYDYRGQPVYYLPPRCCDVPSVVWDEQGQKMCSPDGGMTGSGDGKCPDFFEARTNEKVIWQDTRTR